MFNWLFDPKPANLSRRGFLRALGITVTTIVLSPGGLLIPQWRIICDPSLMPLYRDPMFGIEELAASIQKVGQLMPLLIDKEGRLIAGRRRLEALKLLGRTEAIVQVYEDSASALRRMILDNTACSEKPEKRRNPGVVEVWPL